jgi:Tfp pilus assembly protein PilN
VTAVFLSLIFLLSMLVLFFVLGPLLRSAKTSHQPELLRKLDRLYYERDRLLTNLEDLESDRETQKMNTSDYEELRQQLLSQAAEIYEGIDKFENDSVLVSIETDLNKLEKDLS